MKKIVTIFIVVIVVSAVLFGIAMGVKKYKENNALATADSTINISNDIGNITINESVASEMLSQYPSEFLGINKPIRDYIMKLSETEIFGTKACLVELFLTEDSETPEAIFAISGYDCFVYDAIKNEYLLLTLKGAFSVEVATTGEETTLFYDEVNNTEFHKLIDKFTKEELGFQKLPSEYIMVATGTVLKADDGKLIYVIKMYEQGGTETNYTCAVSNKTIYKYDSVKKVYTKIAE